jgi:hypothetical protein
VLTQSRIVEDPLALTARLAHLMIECADKLSGGSSPTYIAQCLVNFAQCATCRDIGFGMGPNHDASRMCESGKYTHCSCEQCF